MAALPARRQHLEGKGPPMIDLGTVTEETLALKRDNVEIESGEPRD
jgi:hypothetical protein